MMQIWFLFKVVETVIGSVGMIYHILGFQNAEPLPHIMLFCGTFFGFTVVTLMGAMAIVVGSAPSVLVECVVNFFATIMYILTSIMSMYYAENDFHLMYLSDFEEPLHPFFAFCRSQSICALAAGAVHLLHALLATDVLVTKKTVPTSNKDGSSSDSDGDANIDLKRPIRMYFLSRYIEKKLRRYGWFDSMCRQNAPVSLFRLSRIQSYRSSEQKKKSKEKLSKNKGATTTTTSKNLDDTDSEEEVLRSNVFRRSSTDSHVVRIVDEKNKPTEKPSSDTSLKAPTPFHLPEENQSSSKSEPKSKDEQDEDIESSYKSFNAELSNTEVKQKDDKEKTKEK